MKTFLSFREEEPKRRITCGFTYVERAGKTKCQKKLWHGGAEPPLSLHSLMTKGGAPFSADPAAIDYVSVREAQLCLREDNLLLYDMDSSKPGHAFRDMRTMRSAGFRLVVVTMGRFASTGEDEEARLETGLKAQYEQMVQILPRPSALFSAAQNWAIRRRLWRLSETIPPLLKPNETERAFFSLVETMGGAQPLFGGETPPLSHQVELGLALPDHRDRLHWVYVVDPENALHHFHAALAANLASLDLSCPVSHHMRGFEWVRPALAAPSMALRCRSPLPEPRLR